LLELKQNIGSYQFKNGCNGRKCVTGWLIIQDTDRYHHLKEGDIPRYDKYSSEVVAEDIARKYELFV
jgi:hypothetical protein